MLIDTAVLKAVTNYRGDNTDSVSWRSTEKKLVCAFKTC